MRTLCPTVKQDFGHTHMIVAAVLLLLPTNSFSVAVVPKSMVVTSAGCRGRRRLLQLFTLAIYTTQPGVAGDAWLRTRTVATHVL
jgi:hypothetical protein